MRKTLFFGLVLLLLLPFSLFAETAAPYARYCPDPTDIFTGVAHETENTPKITVKVDPVFNAKMKGERSMGDLPLTPVYDLVVTVVPTINEYCLPQYDANGTLIRKVDPPQLFPFTASLVVGNSVTADSTLVIGILKRTETKSDTGEWQYEWKAKGWPNGIADSAKMERLIEAISKNQSVNVIVEVKRPGKETVFEKSPVSFSLCAPVWGSGQHKIVGMYDDGAYANRVVRYFDEIREGGFAKIEPYASNQDFFSYSVDLKKVFGGSITPLAQIALDAKKAGFRTPTTAIQNNVLAQYIHASSCPTGTYLLKVNNKSNSLPWGIGGIALFGGSIQGALIDMEGARLVASSRGASDVSIVYVHEFSHTFAKLNDEYVYRAQSVNVGLPLRNCSVRPAADFSLNGKMYGSTRYQGCSFQYDAGDKPSVPNARYYRPSDKSVMNKDGDEFNVVSCGYILAAIKGGDAKSYFPECAAMDGIIKDGVGQSASVWEGFSSILSLFDVASRSLIAEAGAALQVEEGTPESEASQTSEEDVSVSIDYPYYTKTERWVFKCKAGEKCNDLQGKHTKEEYEKSARDTFLRNALEDIPIVGFGVRLSGLNERSSKKITEVYQPWFAADKGGYGITQKTTTHTYKFFNNPATIKSGKFHSGEGEISTVAEGLRGYRKTIPTDDAPDIEVLPHKGKGQVTVRSENATQDLAIDEDSDAFLHLHTKVSTDLKGILKEGLKELPGKLVGTGINKGLDFIPVPGVGAVIKGTGVLTPITNKIEKTLNKYSTYLVPLSVRVFELIPNPSPSYAVWEIEERPVLCETITVAKKKLDSNCRVTIETDKIHSILKITPEMKKVKVPYYRYEIELAGPVMKKVKADKPSLFAAAYYSLFGLPLPNDTAEEIVFDEDGFIVVPGWNDEKLPLPSDLVEPTNMVFETEPGKAASSVEQGERRAAPTQSSEPSYLIIESFDPNDPWGEIIEVGEGSEVATPTLAASTVASTTPSLLSRIFSSLKTGVLGIISRLMGSSSSLEEKQKVSQPVRKSDTTPADLRVAARGSVDLKVNNENGPVTVLLGAYITLSWTSAEVENCFTDGFSVVGDRLNGRTTIGPVTTEGIYSVSCTTTSGKTVSDSVEVKLQSARTTSPTQEMSNDISESRTLAIPCGAPIVAAAPASAPKPESSGFGYSGDGASFTYDATNYQTTDNSSLITLQANGANLSWSAWSGAYICHLNGIYVPVVGSTKLAPQTTSCSYTLACSDEKEKTRATKSVTVSAE